MTRSGTTTTVCVLAIVAGIAVSTTLWAEPKPGDVAERDNGPPAELELAYNGKKMSVQVDKPFEIDIDGKKVRMTLTQKPYRKFWYAGFRFKYPRHFTYEHDDSTAGTRIWTLSGADTSLIINEMAIAGLTADAARAVFVDNMKTSFAENVKNVSDVSMRLDGKRVVGTRLHVETLGHKQVADIFAVCEGERAVVLVLQHSVTKDGKPTPEGLEVIRYLENTFQFKKR